MERKLKPGGQEYRMVHFAGRFLAPRAGLALLIGLTLSSSAHAQTVSVSSNQSQVGFIGGGSIDPEQVFAGVYWQSPALGGRFHVRPGIEGGFGSDLRLATFNIDFVVRFPFGTSGWNLIQGGGPVIVLIKVDGFEGTRDQRGRQLHFRVRARCRVLRRVPHWRWISAEFEDGGWLGDQVLGAWVLRCWGRECGSQLRPARARLRRDGWL